MVSQHDPSLFKGTAWYYSRYRVPYPPELIDGLASAFDLEGRGRLLDLGCGPGTLALRLNDVFEDVVGVDPDPEMIEEARRLAETAGATNVVWRTERAEDVSSELGTFRLVTMGASFHWMEQGRVLRLCRGLLEDGGGIALVGVKSQFWEGPESWHQEVTRILKRWLGEERRAGSGTFSHPAKEFEEYLRDSDFVPRERLRYRFGHVWTVDSIVGLIFSTSGGARHLFAGRSDDFEREVRSALLSLNPDGTFEQELEAESIFAWKR